MSKKGKAKSATGSPGEQSETKSARGKASASRQVSPEEQRFVLVSRALADPTRMSIVRKIAAGEGRCGDMRDGLGVSAATLSHHLKELEYAGLVALKREGRFVNVTMEKKAWKRYLADVKALMP